MTSMALLRTRTLGNLECLFAVVWLTDQQVFHKDAEFTGILNIQGVFCVHKGRKAPQLLRLCDDVQRQSGFPGRLRSEYLNNAAPRDASDPQSDIQRQTACSI